MSYSINCDVRISDQYYARIVLPRALFTCHTQDGQTATVTRRGFLCLHHDGQDSKMTRAASLMTVDPASTFGPTTDSWQVRGNFPHHFHQVSPGLLSVLPPTTTDIPHVVAQPPPPPQPPSSFQLPSSNVLNQPPHLPVLYFAQAEPLEDSSSLEEVPLDPLNPPGAWNDDDNAQVTPRYPMEWEVVDSTQLGRHQWELETQVLSNGTIGAYNPIPEPFTSTEPHWPSPEQRLHAYEDGREARNLPAGNANTSAGTREASSRLHEIQDPSSGPLQDTHTIKTANLSSDRVGILPGAPNSARIASNLQHPPGTWTSSNSAREWFNNAPEPAPLANEQLGERGWIWEGRTESTGINGPHISVYAAEQAPPSSDRQLGAYKISGSHESAREPNQQATTLPAGAVDKSQPPGKLQEAQRLTPLTSERPSERGGMREAGNWSSGLTGTCSNDHRALAVAQPLLSATEPRPSAHTSARDAQNLSAGITRAGSGTREVLDWKNDTFGECRTSFYPQSVAQPPLSTVDQRSSAYTNTRNAKNLPAGNTSASSGAREASDRTNNTFSQRLRAYPNGRDAINLPAGITSGSFGARESSSAHHDDRTTKNSATGVQCPSSEPAARKTISLTDESPQLRISAQHDERTSKNSATGVQCPSSGSPGDA